MTLNTFAPMLQLLVPGKAAELATLTDVAMGRQEAVGAEALLCHFFASFFICLISILQHRILKEWWKHQKC